MKYATAVALVAAATFMSQEVTAFAPSSSITKTNKLAFTPSKLHKTPLFMSDDDDVRIQSA